MRNYPNETEREKDKGEKDPIHAVSEWEKQKCPLAARLLDIGIGDCGQCNKENEWINEWMNSTELENKEINLSLYIDNIIIYVENYRV